MMPPRLLLFMFRLGLPITVDRVLSIACFESRNLGHNFIGSEHVLCALLRTPDSRISELFARRDIDLEKVRSGVVSVDTLGSHHSRKFRPQTPRLKKIVPIAESEASRLTHLTVPQSLMVGILVEGNGVAARVLKQLGADLGQLRRDLETPSESRQPTATAP